MSTSAPDEELLGALGHGKNDSKVFFETYTAGEHVALTANRLCGLRHPHLVRVLSVERIGDAWSIASEHVDGVSLAEVFHNLSVGARLRVVVDVLTALSALHVADGGGPIVHRGILLSSAYVEKTGRTKVGFAYRSPLRLGKESYAPEVLLSDEGAIDVRTDVYGAGVLLWEALTGKPLFGAMTSEQVVKKQLAARIEKALPPTSDRWARSVLPVVDRALAVDPKERYATIAEMAAALRIAVRARLMIHEDIIEEVWPAETNKLASGAQPVAAPVLEQPISEMKVPVTKMPAEELSLAPAPVVPEEGASSGIIPTNAPRAMPRVLWFVVAFVLVAAVVITLGVAFRPRHVAPSVVAPVIEAPVQAPIADPAPVETMTPPPQAQSAAPPALQPAPHKATKRPPKSHVVYDPASI